MYRNLARIDTLALQELLLLEEHLIDSFDFMLFTPGIEYLDQGVEGLKFVDVSKR
jgi:hypothetical protein